MAPWGDAKLFLCILVIGCYYTVTLAQVPQDCCLSAVNKTIEHRVIADYRHQIAGQGCHISATVLVTRRQRTICVPDNEPWVKAVMKHVDELKAFCKKRSNKSNRCKGVRSQ